MDKNLQKSTSGVILIAFFCLFLYGFLDNLKGATLPDLLVISRLNYSQGGAILQGAYLGFLISTLVTGFLLRRYSHREILFFAIVLAILGVISFTLFTEYVLLIGSMVIIGLSLGFFDLIGVRLIIDFYKNNTGQLLNLSAFFHGLASTAAPVFAGLILTAGLRWQTVYQISILFVIIFLVFLFTVRIPFIKKDVMDSSTNRFVFFNALREKKAWPYYIMIMSYESIEIGFAVWVNEYLQTVRQMPASIGYSFISIFFLCLMLGRFLGSLIVEKIGYLRLILITAVIVSICLFIGIFGPDQLIFFLPFSGFFLSVIFPTTTAAASKDLTRSNTMSLSLLFTFAGLGGMAGSWIIGMISDIYNLKIGFTFLILMAISVATISLWILKGKNKEEMKIVKEQNG